MANFHFAFIDMEFGGLDPELHDITEIAVILTDYRLAELGQKEWKVRARADRITREAAAISGYDAKVWAAEAVPVRQALEELTALLPKGITVVPAGQNVRMDVQFLERGYKSCELPYPFDYHVIDLATLFYVWSLVAGHTVPALSLRQAATHAGLVEGGVEHRAMADTRLTLETFRYYVGRLAPRSLPDAPPSSEAEGGADVGGS
ncbi:MAG: 3'-5' exonuclease [Deltaproteobacteria bacterium]|nr:3'-5' exonuclease [Deltaproteobacteria bacterium]